MRLILQSGIVDACYHHSIYWPVVTVFLNAYYPINLPGVNIVATAMPISTKCMGIEIYSFPGF